MRLKLERTARESEYTIGRLYVNGAYECDTLEDRDRGLSRSMPLSEIKERKVYGQTAIPTGEYRVTLSVRSPKYSAKATWRDYNGGFMPRLLSVPGWEGVLIHPGNTSADTEGCVLVGRNTQKGMVTGSTAAFKALYAKMREAVGRRETITLEIV